MRYFRKMLKLIRVCILMSIVLGAPLFLLLQFSGILSERSASVLKIRPLTGPGVGSAFPVKFKGVKYLITAAHVCADNSVLTTPNHAHIVIYAAKHLDICILSATGLDVEPIPLGVKNVGPPWLNIVKTVGYPGGEGIIISHGSYVRKSFKKFATTSKPPCPSPEVKSIYKHPFFGPQEHCVNAINGIETTAKVLPGNSGGPALDVFNRVIGVVIAYSRFNGHGFYVGINQLRLVLERASEVKQ